MLKIEENKINGGSYRIFCKKNVKRSITYKEKTSLSDIKKFIKRVKENKERCLAFIKKCNDRGEKVFLYGASTKGNTLLQYYGIDSFKDIKQRSHMIIMFNLSCCLRSN